LYLSDIIDACRRIERIASGRDDDLLVSDEIVRDAILYNIGQRHPAGNGKCHHAGAVRR
jgi:uncharacterized protein with HEPN domain